MALHSLAHAALALAAGGLAEAISRVDAAGAASLSNLGPWEVSPRALVYVGLGSALVKAGAGTIVASLESGLAAEVAARARRSVLERLLDAGSAVPAPRVLSSLSVRVRELQGAVTGGVTARVRSVAQLVPIGCGLVLLSPRLAAIAALVVLPFVAGTRVLRDRLRGGAARSHTAVEQLELGVDELVRNVDLFRAYGAAGRGLSAVARASEVAAHRGARLEAARAALSGSNEVLAALALVVASLVGPSLARDLGDTPLLPFAAMFFMAYRPLRDLGDSGAWLARGAVALEAIDALRDTRAAPAHPPADVPARWSGAPPELDLVEFGAEGRGPATSMRVSPGEIVCVVGPTGSGKTTLVRALLGLEPSRGRLLVGGEDRTLAPAGPAARPFAWVPQDAPLVTGTLEENVALLGGVAADVAEALRAVGAEWLSSRAGADVVGPGGRPLSGGERRLVSLARAFASGLPVLVLDEPTEGLDEPSQAAVRRALSRLRGARSVIVTTHRDDVVALADRVVGIGAARTDASARRAAE